MKSQEGTIATTTTEYKLNNKDSRVNSKKETFTNATST